MNKEDEDTAALVQSTFEEIANKLYELKIPVDVGMAATSMLLATACKARRMSEHEAISRFTTSVKQVYKHIDTYGHPHN